MISIRKDGLTGFSPCRPLLFQYYQPLPFVRKGLMRGRRLAKTDLAPILETRPQIAQELSRALAQQQAAGRALTIAERDKTDATRR
jgi:hypothetical protein